LRQIKRIFVGAYIVSKGPVLLGGFGVEVDIYKGDSNPINSFGEWKESMSFHSEPWSKNALNAAQSILYLSITNRYK
jgi:hypothetical protein